MSEKKEQCPEFPYFGAWYPDACCIDGYLWDLDSYDDGFLTSGGNDPCPFCNTESYVEMRIDEEGGVTREDILNTIAKWRKRYGNKEQQRK